MRSPEQSGESTVGPAGPAADSAAPAPAPAIVRGDAAAIRVGSWSGAPGVAHLVAVPGHRSPDRDTVEAAVRTATVLGYTAARTGALTPDETAAFAGAGFAVETTLVLLRHDLGALADPPRARLRRPASSEWPAIAALDHAAFPAYWHFDAGALREACAATPSCRVRVIGRPIVGYSIVGRSGRNGFVQRLAVDPAFAGRGLGRTLVLDGLRWLRRRSVEQAFVNTQRENTRAVTLYENLGFVVEPRPLVIMVRSITAPST